MRNITEHKKYVSTIFIISLLLLQISCSPLKLPPILSPLDINSVDYSSLKDRIIVIDPGHGGDYPGAVSPKGLEEADLNLAVALLLWGLLKEAGAQPSLTRTADVNVMNNRKAVLKEDLKRRADFINNTKPDLFISIHHNSNEERYTDQITEIYYQVSLKESSKTIARSILEAFKGHSKVKRAMILPGNFHILRNSRYPGILGEAAYINNKNTEIKLMMHTYLRQEAETYFLGIVNYFNKEREERKPALMADQFIAKEQPPIKHSVILDLLNSEYNCSFASEVRTNLSGLFTESGLQTLSVDKTIPIDEKMVLAENSGANLYLTLACGCERRPFYHNQQGSVSCLPDENLENSPSVRYYYGSVKGKGIAKKLSQTLNINNLTGKDYLLAHTSMTALFINLPDKGMKTGKANEWALTIYHALTDFLLMP